jgi:penicillin G amidase
MEFQRRIGNGRLSEFAGPAQLPCDKFLRTLGAARAAKSAFEALDPEARKPIEAYVAGVNAFIEKRSGLPVEFTVVGVTPELWRPEDVLVWGKMMAWDLSGGDWSTDLLRARMIEKLGAAKTAELMPDYPADAPTILPDTRSSTARPKNFQRSAVGSDFAALDSQLAALLEFDRVFKAQFDIGDAMVGSNNWVIGGSRTTTGKPLLANDPHLGFRIPSLWYLAHITGGPLDAIGATLPGVPSIIIGHNQRIAWGVTNTGPDVQDWFIEHINDKNEAEFRRLSRRLRARAAVRLRKRKGISR